MDDSVPTRAERIAAVVAVVALLSSIGFAAFGSALPAIVGLFVVVTCGTIAKARVSLESLLTFGLRTVPEDDPRAIRYRERRQREERRIREAVERTDNWVSSHPRFETALLLGLALVGVCALVAVPTVADGNSRLAGRLLLVALVALNGALIGYAASKIDATDTEERENE